MAYIAPRSLEESGRVSIAIRADFDDLLRNNEKQNGSNISALSSTEWTHRYQKVAYSHVGLF